ncbi:hypothetical protein [Streptomyces mutabilis]|uniref:Uncharacterized protein n=1 Tax=Streptomyces mutabilis TaxID=67332 RepID=A0A086MS24_9ACTN|nr:hypothetical protein [Streptomyces mutabilis]KFG71692.1 hypothetical protein FM21_33620 [Streptomyces mutabilis]
MLKTWAENGRHRADVVGVMVSESPGHDDPGAVMRPFEKRDEMWLATRVLLQPDPGVHPSPALVITNGRAQWYRYRPQIASH